MKNETTANSPDFWAEHIKAFEKSGLSRPEYCRRHGLKTHQLDYRLGRLSSKAAPSSALPGFARAVALPTMDRPSVRGPGAIAITFGSDADPVWAARFLAAIAKETR